MLVWLDNHLSPALAAWISHELGVVCVPVRALGLERAQDIDIFHAARAAGASLMTKDADFVALVERFGPPPAVLLLTCGNTSDMFLRSLLATTLGQALALIQAGEPLVEIGGLAD